MHIEEMNDQMAARIRKIDKLRNMGVEPYSPVFHKTHTSRELIENRNSFDGEEAKIAYAGRIVRYNRKGKICFIHVKDEWGKIQTVLSASEIGEKKYEVVKMVDLGDWIGVTGRMFTTKTGEYSVLAKQFHILSKSIRPLPTPKEKVTEDGAKVIFDEFSDKEARYRQRYVDLALNDTVRLVFRRRSQIISSLRSYLINEGYMEVETPVLQPVYGGANARPFVTHHNSADMNLYLRISNELYLKRCIIGGFEKVFEFAKDFRNEGIDKTHNPEFTMLEFYQAFADYNVMMHHVEVMIESACMQVHGTTSLEYSDMTIDVTTPWPRLRLKEAVKQHTGIDVDMLSEIELTGAAAARDIELTVEPTRGEVVNALFENFVAPKLIQPHIILDYYRESSPLCRSHRKDPDLIEQFEVYIGGMEIGNSYSELIDPAVQRKLLEDQANQVRGKSIESHPVDKDFIFALESGMPPTGGVGIGIDRLVMLLTDSASIRDVLLFPLMKPVIE